MICRQHGDEMKEEEEEIDPLDAYLQEIDAEVKTYEEKSNVDAALNRLWVGEQE